MPDKTRIDFGEEKQSFTCDAPLRTQFREFLESRGIHSESQNLGNLRRHLKVWKQFIWEIADKLKGISQADGDALIGEFLKRV